MTHLYKLLLGAAGLVLLHVHTAQAQQGIGMGSTPPRTTLDVNGPTAAYETTATLSGASPTYQVPAVGQVQLSGTPTGTIGLTTAAAVPGQRLVVFNNTGVPATLNGQLIPAAQASEFVYSASGWRVSAGGANGVAASNGLTKTGNTVQLGGPLTQATAVANNGQALTVAGSGSSTTFAPSGNVGFGIASPISSVDVAGGILTRARLILGRSDGGDPATTKTWQLDNSANSFRLFEQPNIGTTGTVHLAIQGTSGNAVLGPDPNLPNFDPSAKLEVRSANSGLLIPRIGLLSATDATTIPAPATSLMVYNTNAALPGGTGYYFNAGTSAAANWQHLLSSGAAQGQEYWSLTGNAGTNPLTNFLGTTDAQPQVFRANNVERLRLRLDGGVDLPGTNQNMFIGGAAGISNTTGQNNVFLGLEAGRNNTTGTANIFSGTFCGSNNTTGSSNQFSGYAAGNRNTTGGENLFNGNQAGYSNTSGSYNLFNGSGAGYNNTTGNGNHFSGHQAGYNNTTGSNNLFSGFLAGLKNTTGGNNLFSGTETGFFNTTGSANLFYGSRAGYLNTTGGNNLFSGVQAGYNNTTGNNNLFSGYSSGSANLTGSNNYAYGYNAGPTVDGLTNAGAIGYQAGVGLSNALVLGGTGTNAVNVGIGTTTPHNTLDLGAAGGNLPTDPAAKRLAIYNNTAGTDFYGLGVSSAQLDFFASGTPSAAPQMVLLNDGKVGIGTTTPIYPLNVVGGAVSTGSSGYVGFADRADNTKLYNWYATGGRTTLGLYNSTNGVSTDLLTATSAGNVGIGTTAPTQALDVRGNIRIGNDGANTGSGSAVEFVGPGGNSDPIGFYRVNSGYNVSELRLVMGDDPGGPNADKLVLGTTNQSGVDQLLAGTFTPKFTVVSDGSLGIGTSTPAYKIDVVGDINASGSVRASGVALTSDRRLKRNIVPTAYGLNTVLGLKPVQYEKKASIAASDYSRHEIGFIAQDVQQLLPSLVTEGQDANKTLAVSYTELIPVLTKAIQEQQAQIEALKAANAKLAVANATLQTSLDGKASASTVDALQAALQALRGEMQALQAAGTTARSK